MTKQDEIIEMAKQCGLIDIHYEIGQWDIHEVITFAKLVEERKLKEVAAACERLPFGETAQSFAVWIREQA